MAASNYSLKVNRQLLDPSFESYRLSLDHIPIYNVELDAAVAEVKLKDSQYSLDHVRAFGMYNYLHIDPWYEDSVYFVDCKGRVLNLNVTLVSLLSDKSSTTAALWLILRPTSTLKEASISAPLPGHAPCQSFATTPHASTVALAPSALPSLLLLIQPSPHLAV
ncbi:hypothetical protein UPYG_G00342580 [Umbra pygmaea]|uniref:Uncharacterized protein n=1 Tax=Umbra pygmaea TaxID=75934 RepID=A0ABD0VYQ5_UMBPY